MDNEDIVNFVLSPNDNIMALFTRNYLVRLYEFEAKTVK